MVEGSATAATAAAAATAATAAIAERENNFTNLIKAEKEFENFSKLFKCSDEFDKFKNRPDDFRKFINGLFQAEGTISVYFRHKKYLNVAYFFSIGQNYSLEAAKVLILLQYFLGGIGKFKFYISDNNIIHIKFIVFDKNSIMNVIKPYFSLIYGDKEKAFLKLERINFIIADLSNINKNLTYELINLVYNLNPEGNNTKMSINEKLELFALPLRAEQNNNLTYKQDYFPPIRTEGWVPTKASSAEEQALPSYASSAAVGLEAPINLKNRNRYAENTGCEGSAATLHRQGRVPDILFIIGLFIGDGSLYYSIYDSKTSKFKFSLKIICDIVSLKNNDSNELLINLIIKNLETIQSNLKQTQSLLNIKSELNSSLSSDPLSNVEFEAKSVGEATLKLKKGGLASLYEREAEGLPKTKKIIYISKKNQRTLKYSGSYVFKNILPVFSQHMDWFFWRKSQIKNALLIASLFENKEHLSEQGLKKIINILYSQDNKYKNSKEYWLNLIEKNK